jgi:3-hydroxybutyryl-CoA dehydrogenase
LTVEKIAVVGAGVMGRGIAHTGALGGFGVGLHDVDRGTLKNATSSIEKEMKKAVEKGRLEEVEMQEALNRISTSEDLEEAVSGAGSS